jgi:putative lipoprotein
MSAGCERKATMVSRANGRGRSIIDGKSDSFVDAKSKMTIELDTIVRDWHMLLQTADNGIKIKNENFYDKTLFVTIVKNGKTLFHQKAVTTPWLLGSPDNERQLYAGPLIAVSNTTVYLFVGSYLPETDDGFTYILAFSKDGNVNKYQMPQSLDESDLVTEFYLLYSHECFYEPFDAESLQQIIKEYCTDELLWKIKQQGKFAIFPPKISDRHSLKFDVASEMIDIDTTKMLLYSRIYFYKRHSYQPLDSMKVVLKGRRNEYKGVNYDKILSINH